MKPNKKRRTFAKLAATAAFLISVPLASCTERAKIPMMAADGTDANAKRTMMTRTVKSGGAETQLFGFSEENISALTKNDGGFISLGVVIGKSKKKSSGKFAFGILGDGEFKTIKEIPARATVKGTLGETGEENLKVSICARSGDARGFFVMSDGGVRAEECSVGVQSLGYDLSGSIPHLAFGQDGGTADIKKASGRGIDTTGAEKTFPVSSSALEFIFSDKAAADGKTATEIAFNGEKFYVRKPKSSSTSLIPLSAAKNPFGNISLTQNAGQISSLMLTRRNIAEGKTEPIKTDPGLVVWWPRKNWRGTDYELFEWDRFPGVLLMDIATYSIQDDFFRRLAYFVEKAGYRGTLYPDTFLADKHGYNAHDYKAKNLAEFFEKARVEKFPLNERELLLKKILCDNGVIVIEKDGSVSEGRGAIISISQESQPYLRKQLLAHEGWHGIFFSDKDFRDFVYRQYDLLDDGCREYLTRYFQVTPSLNYDTSDEYLLRNEFMAYMLQKPVEDIPKYFIDMASRRHSQDLAKPEADYVLATGAAGFLKASKALDAYVNERWNLNAGRIWLAN